MKLPNGSHAVVSVAKINGYLLSFEHPRGRLKARFFVSVGYSPASPEELVHDLVAHARNGDIVDIVPSRFGTRYVVEGMIVGPNGVPFGLRSVWIALTSETGPRFVTAYPIDRPWEA